MSTDSSPTAAERPDPAPVPRMHHGFDHAWHVAINAYANAVGRDVRWMYDAKNVAQEVPRLALVFGQERRGELAKVHRQCSLSAPEPVPENYTTCCLGVRCSECPHLLAIEAAANLSDAEKDTAKAWTCCAHIVANGGDMAGEGFILTVDDRMYWSRVYESLSWEPPEPRAALEQRTGSER